MKFICLDIETLGLNPDSCDVIEIGAVARDSEDPPCRWPDFHAYVLPGSCFPNYIGQPGAMSMHAEILRRIDKREQPFDYVSADQILVRLVDWVMTIKDQLRISTDKVIFGGKNLASFDLLFLRRLKDYGHLSGLMAHRILDPGSMFVRAADTQIPSLQECMQRAGIEGRVPHTATEDADLTADVIVQGLLAPRALRRTL